MKLTLSVGGGVTGLFKEHTIDVNVLDERTRTSLINYIHNRKEVRSKNFTESWIINNEEEIPIDRNKMNPELRQLYMSMKNNLQYPKR